MFTILNVAGLKDLVMMMVAGNARTRFVVWWGCGRGVPCSTQSKRACPVNIKNGRGRGGGKCVSMPFGQEVGWNTWRGGRVGPSWCLCMLACIQSADPSQLCSTHYRVGCAQHFPVMAAKVKLAGVVLGVSMASTKLMPVASEVVEGV